MKKLAASLPIIETIFWITASLLARRMVDLAAGQWQMGEPGVFLLKIAVVLGLIAFAPEIKKFRPRHWWSAVLVLVSVVVFFLMMAESFQHVGQRMGPRLHELEQRSPP